MSKQWRVPVFGKMRGYVYVEADNEAEALALIDLGDWDDVHHEEMVEDYEPAIDDLEEVK